MSEANVAQPWDGERLSEIKPRRGGPKSGHGKRQHWPIRAALLGLSNWNHILDVSLTPAEVSSPAASAAVEIAHAVMTQLDVVGVLCVEFDAPYLLLERRLTIRDGAVARRYNVT